MATCAINPEPLRMIDVEGSFGVTVTFRGIRIRSEVEISGAGNHGTDDRRTRPAGHRRARVLRLVNESVARTIPRRGRRTHLQNAKANPGKGGMGAH